MTATLYRRCIFFLLISAMVLAWIGRYSDLDLHLADSMYDFHLMKFRWTNDWFAAVFMHRWMKVTFIGLGIALFVGVAVDRTLNLGWLSSASHCRISVVLISSALVPLTVSVIKATSIHACPWNLERYGGDAPYLRLFDHLPDAVAAGHCFPGGHASSALWLGAFAVMWLPERPRVAATAFALLMIPGFLLGWVQQMRGAHFLTHTLWSAWIAGLIISTVARFIYAQFAEEWGWLEGRSGNAGLNRKGDHNCATGCGEALSHDEQVEAFPNVRGNIGA
jgi:membrane-associated PAP2 superfamily phosphatase